VVGAERERLEDLWAAVEEVAVRRPFLAASVRAFARARFSATTAARSLHVHPNTLAYRLDRWHQLTGWDPRTFDGLQNSMLVLAQQPGYEAGSRSSR
jgi:DNA-binding PucR family transcriptional regulator